MTAKIDAGKCIELFIKYKDVVFTLIDEMDFSEANYGVNLDLYNYECRKLIKLVGKVDPADAKRLAIAFEIDNLRHNGLIVGVDKKPNANKITFQTFFIDLFRHLDNKRVKSLSNSDYETIRVEFLSLLETFKRISITNESNEFTEAYETLTQKLTDTLVLIKRNTDSLRGSAARLSEYIDKLDNDKAEPHSNPAIQKLEELTKLYERKVIPSIEFLNPNQPMEGGNTFVRLIRQIEDLLNEQQPKLAAYIQYRHIAITSYHKDIKEIQRALLSYYKRHKRSRDIFNAIEITFNKLKSESYQLHDGKMINNKIPLSNVDSVIIKNNKLHGIKSFSNSFNAKICWDEENSISDLKELIRVFKENRALETVNKSITPSIKNEDLAEKRDKKRRQIRIVQLVNSLEMDVSYYDIFESIHHLLSNSIDDYQLIDGIHGYRSFMAKPDIKRRLNQTRDGVAVKYGNYEYRYWRRSLEQRQEA
ncbi:hypothetical protein tloyanaT_32480 [Thalassotalea loyana]|uniref:DUF2326 domain-containing protein n=1 Tax=Thalassotalea loyana TaxID=280483 RepID=A0ABQ6HJ44_9GAMM|nr:hypothetical protein [Thalassotalea loyana]GLX86995.1 hypothetical protein tloyanaT_32480 [Thalassotalea loyana]